MNTFVDYYKHKGHVFGECLSHADSNLMYVYIPKNATSWTKPNLKDWGWETFNYHTDDLYHKHAMIVLRDPIERWLSGIGEYMYLYHRTLDAAHLSGSFFDMVFDRIAFDDHTDRQILFVDRLNFQNCTFFWCDQTYRNSFSTFLAQHNMPNRYANYDYQHTSDSSAARSYFKKIFQTQLEKNSKYMYNLKQYFAQDYNLIESTQFYAG